MPRPVVPGLVAGLLSRTSRLATAWQLVVKRSLAHWRLLSAVVLGVLLATAIMAGTFVYYDAVAELALAKTLAKHTGTELDILVRWQEGSTSYSRYMKTAASVDAEIGRRVAWLLTDRIDVSKTPTFYLLRPGSEGPAEDSDARTYFASVPRVREHISVLPGGRMPGAQPLNPQGAAPEVEAIIAVEEAQLFGVAVGDRLVAVPHWEDAHPFVTVVISGVFQRNDPQDEFWYLEQNVLQDATRAFPTVGFHVSQGAFMDVLGTSFVRMNSVHAWRLVVDTSRIDSRNAKQTLLQMEQMNRSLASTVPDYGQTSALDNALRDYDQRIFFSKQSMFMVLILVAVVALYHVATSSSLVVEDRRGEIALLRSRGANSAQILTVFILEGGTIAVLATLVGPLLAAGAIGMLGYTPALSDLTGGGRLAAGISDGAYKMSGLGGLLSFIALVFPAVQASRIGVIGHRQQSARPTSQPAFQRYYLDVLLLLMSIYLFRQMTEHGSVLATNLLGEVRANELLLAVPGLALVASAMVLLRLFPPAMRLGSRILSRWLSVGLMLGMWQMARNPTHYARSSLLLVLTAGLGMFAASFGATLERSFTERVLHSTGSDIRVAAPPGQIGTLEETSGGPTNVARRLERLPDVEAASPVLRGIGHDLSRFHGESFVLLGVEPDNFGEVAWFRDDFSAEPMGRLLKSLRVLKWSGGIDLPHDTRSVGVRLRPDRAHPTLQVAASIRYAGSHSPVPLPLGTLDSDHWMLLEADLMAGLEGRPALPSHPPTLVSLRITQTREAERFEPGWLVIDDIRVRTDTVEARVIEGFEDVSGWRSFAQPPGVPPDVILRAKPGSDGGAGWAIFSWQEGNPARTHGLLFNGFSRDNVLPVLASKSFVRATGRSRGDEFEASIGGARKLVRLVDTIDLFPSVTTPNEKFLVADLRSLDRVADLASLGGTTDLPSLTGYGRLDRLSAIVTDHRANEFWIATTSTGPRRKGLMQQLEDFGFDPIDNRAERMGRSKADPLVEAGWEALLFLTLSAVLALSCLAFLLHGYVSFRNRLIQFATVRTIGFSIRQLATVGWMEQMLVIAIGLALGSWMGGQLGATIMPFLGHDDSGNQVVPPFVMEVNWGTLLPTYAAIFVVLAVINIGLLQLITRVSLHRALRLGEM